MILWRQLVELAPAVIAARMNLVVQRLTEPVLLAAAVIAARRNLAAKPLAGPAAGTVVIFVRRNLDVV